MSRRSPNDEYANVLGVIFLILTEFPFAQIRLLCCVDSRSFLPRELAFIGPSLPPCEFWQWQTADSFLSPELSRP